MFLVMANESFILQLQSIKKSSGNSVGNRANYYAKLWDLT